MTTGESPVDQVAGFLEAFSGLYPIPNEAGFAFEQGDDIADADAEVLRRIVALRDVLLGLRDYLGVCGGHGRVPGILIWRGNLAQQELERRHEGPYYGPPSRHRAPSTGEESKPGVKDKKEARKRRRGRIPDVEVGRT